MVIDDGKLPGAAEQAAAFIDAVLVADIAKAVEAGAVSVGFRAITQGIVVLGSLVDGAPFHFENLTDQRFKETLRHFFPSQYKTYNNPNSACFFYEDLKFVMVHPLRADTRTIFLDRAQARPQGISHLMTQEIEGRKKVILVLEDFFEDFKGACEQVKAHLRARTESVAGAIRG
jgi:hypothetical protein